MIVEEYTLIRVSLSNKEKLDGFKITKRETYNSILKGLIKLGEEKDFKRIRIEDLAKNLEDKNDQKIKVKQKANP